MELDYFTKLSTTITGGIITSEYHKNISLQRYRGLADRQVPGVNECERQRK